MVKHNIEDIPVSTAESLLINLCAPIDSGYYRLRALVHPKRYGGASFREIHSDVCERRVNRYKKLLAMKKHYGDIPERVVRTCFSSPCDYTRLFLASLRN